MHVPPFDAHARVCTDQSRGLNCLCVCVSLCVCVGESVLFCVPSLTGSAIMNFEIPIIRLHAHTSNGVVAIETRFYFITGEQTLPAAAAVK